MIRSERQDGDAQSDGEGGVSLPTNPAEKTCAGRQTGSTVDLIPHTELHAYLTAPSIPSDWRFMSAERWSWSTCSHFWLQDHLESTAWLNAALGCWRSVRPCSVHRALPRSSQTSPLIVIFKWRTTAAPRLPLANHVTWLDNLYAGDCITQTPQCLLEMFIIRPWISCHPHLTLSLCAVVRAVCGDLKPLVFFFFGCCFILLVLHSSDLGESRAHSEKPLKR